MLEINYNPDVLSCLANLSNDEVFTPPKLVNDMLDLLPEELWTNPNATFLDPVTKTGVFLREIAKRLMKGLESQIPNNQERVNHIFSKQIYGIAITELTSLLSRRSVYCSKTANGKYSISEIFETEHGNILFKRMEHTWESGKCIHCGASREVYERDDSLETYAYNFIHAPVVSTGLQSEAEARSTNWLTPVVSTPLNDLKGSKNDKRNQNAPKNQQENNTQIGLENLLNMKFDVIIGNPPYQLNDGGFGTSASPIYHKFVEQAKKLNPRYLTMIIPARWYSGGKGLDEFRNEMLNDNRIREIVDFPEAIDCFPGVQIKGGVGYFLWDRDNPGMCKVSTSSKGKITSTMTRSLLEPGSSTFIRYNEAISIVKKVQKFKEQSIKGMISSRKPFGLDTTFKGKNKPFSNSITLYQNGGIGYIKETEIKSNHNLIGLYKTLIPPLGSGSDSFPHPILGKSFVVEPYSACTETYLVAGSFEHLNNAENLSLYLSTKFLRFLVLLNKPTQHATSKVYTLVPIQDFSEPWTDEKLYKKYGLTQEEIDFIESMIRPMD